MVKKCNAIQTTDTSNSVKTTNYSTKIAEIEKKILDHDHGKNITTQGFDKLKSKKFAVRLKEAKLSTKKDIVDFIKKTDFDKKLKNINKKVISNKTRHLGLIKK